MDSCPTDPLLVTESVRFASGPYQLDGKLAYPEALPVWAAAVIAGPHPLLGGNMQNNVVRCLADGLAERGLATLRFDYRGVGLSEGPPVDVAANLALFWQTSHVAGEADLHCDLEAAASFLTAAGGEALPLAAIGYSFGCALLPHLEALPELSSLVLIAPTVGSHDYRSFDSVRCPLLAIASEDDFAASPVQVREWFDRLSAPRQLILRRFDNHFFRQHESWLAETVVAFLREQLKRSRDHVHC